MRNISFMLTKPQIQARTKTVTRRTGWKNLKSGQMLKAVEKSRRLKKDETIAVIAHIRVVDVRREKLRRLIDEPAYGASEIINEGFARDPELNDPAKWVAWFCASHKGCTPETEVTRIEFEFVEPSGLSDGPS